MAIRRPQATFDGAATDGTGRLNLELQQALINHDARTQVVERAIGIGGLNPDKKTKVAVAPPRSDIALAAGISGSGAVTLSITNPEFIRGRGNPLRTPIYHRIRHSPDPTFHHSVTELPPSVQTHWPLQVTPGVNVWAQVSSSYDGINWTLPIVKGPVKA